ncbi:suppressor of zeste 2 [Musca autumnalis]|uniref:suppressor of zeste 2 n=1 Tax=Musca autumnalis TaxID=221902 RepID=UPI003CEABA91
MQLLAESTTTNTTTNVNSDHTLTKTQTSNNMDKFHPPKPKINAFNELFQCYLCQGYLINPTTIDACLHTYCRSCIVRHLAEDCYCPRCKGNGGKAVTHSNLKSDNVLRSIIYKMVPGLYQKERERVVQFLNNAKNEGYTDTHTLLEVDDDFYTARDSISLSLEFHPHLAEQCEEADIPPVRYLKCLASLKIQHLKRFLCSKFDIDPSNRKVDIEIIYEDEVLPSDFTLMDVAYCYQYKGQAPLKLYYRILIYPEENNKTPETENKNGVKTHETEISSTEAKAEPSTKPLKGEENPFLTPIPVTTKLKTSKTSASKHQSTDLPSVKMTITTSKPTESVKKTVSKKSSLVEEFSLPTTTNDFKSLRSNDIRYSQYAVPPPTPATPSNTGPHNTTSSKTKMKTEKPIVIKEEKPAKCDIVVSIPQNQMQDEWDTKPLSQLKTACKKSPPTSNSSEETTSSAKKVRNVPKLKIELNSLKSKLIEKPKSADIRLDTLMLKQHKPRKFSLDEPQLSNDKVDLETYVKNIGLKPIEVHAPTIHTAPAEMETTDKFTPNASPRSSCSSSTTSSSNGYLHVSGEHSSSKSSHKKRKKKHSKESKDSKRSKKMHAEISSQMADESLKMKVKLTTPLNIKPSKLESKKSPHNDKFHSEQFSFDKPLKSPENKAKLIYENAKSSEVEKSLGIKDKFQFPVEKKPSAESSSSSSQKLKPLAIKTTAKDFEDDDDISMPDIATALSLSKPLANIKDSKLPHSPPLPPSLFKTTPITFSTFTPNVSTVAKTKPVVTAAAKPIKDKPVVHPIKMKPLAPKPMPTAKPPSSTPIKPPQFAVPNLPRLMASNSSKFLTSTPSSIASSANKQMGNLLKRSASMDEGKSAKQSKLDKPHQITVSAYGSNLQVTKVEVPATPTSSTAKATYEIPLYSPLSASYNPKCSFTVGSTTSGTGGRGNITNSLNSPTGLSSGNSKSPIFTTNTTSLKKPEKETGKLTTAKTTNSTGTTSTANLISYGINKTSALMGPPSSLPKLNTVVPTSVKSPPLGHLVNKGFSATPSPSFGLLNARSNTSPSSSATGSTMQSIKKSEPTTNSTTAPTTTATIKNANGPMEKTTSSLRQFRLPSRESGQDILDLSATTKTTNGLQTTDKKPVPKTVPTVNIPALSPTTTTGSPLELALSKIKQNMTSNLCPAEVKSNNSIDLKPNSEDLQNLHLLSESATAREKIAITATSSSTTSSTSVYEKPKINTNSLVRQQNASVRSIPNPSALAFRNQPSTNNIPMVTIAAPLIASLSNEADKSFLSKQPTSPHSPLNSLPLGSNVTTSSITPLRSTITATSLSAKRHPSIDQVAASLNIRATAAAAEASAKSNLKQLDEVAGVASKSSLAEINGGSKLKQQIKQEAVEPPTTSTCVTTILAPPNISHSSSSEVSSSEIVEIKKEPEERCSESSSSPCGEEQREVKAIFAISNNNNNSSIGTNNNIYQSSTSASSSLVSKVENLVTSVINVSTPTSNLLTTSSAGY